MEKPSLEERVAALERTVGELLSQNGNGKSDRQWIQSLGMFTGDEAMKEIFDEALKFRERDRERARRRYAKKPAKRRVKK